MTYDEGPSPEDIERFSTGDAYCPECGEEVFDDLDYCPHCGNAMRGGARLRSPVHGDFHRRMIAFVVVLVLIGLLMWWVF